MGSVVLPVRQLLSEPQQVLDQWVHLDGASPESKVLLRAELKVCEYIHTQVSIVTDTRLFHKTPQVWT